MSKLENLVITSDVDEGEVVGEIKNEVKTIRNEDGTAQVEIKTVFVVENPDEVFAHNGPGISMYVRSNSG